MPELSQEDAENLRAKEKTLDDYYTDRLLAILRGILDFLGIGFLIDILRSDFNPLLKATAATLYGATLVQGARVLYNFLKELLSSGKFYESLVKALGVGAARTALRKLLNFLCAIFVIADIAYIVYGVIQDIRSLDKRTENRLYTLYLTANPEIRDRIFRANFGKIPQPRD